MDAPTSDLSISTVVSPSLGRCGYNAVRADEPFTVCGGGLVEGVVATLTDAKGAEHLLTVELAKGLSMVCRSEAPLAKGAAKRTVSSLGGEGGDVFFSDMRQVKVL